jgi:hypothetical protein
VVVSAYLNGNMIVNGSIGAASIAAGNVTIDKLGAGTVAMAANIGFSLGTVSTLKLSDGNFAKGVAFLNTSNANWTAALVQSNVTSVAMIIGQKYPIRDTATSEAAALIVSRHRNSTYIGSPYTQAVIGLGSIAGVYRNYSRVIALSAKNGGNDPIDTQVEIAHDTGTLTFVTDGQVVAANQTGVGLTAKAYNRNLSAWTLAGGTAVAVPTNAPLASSAQLAYYSGTGLVYAGWFISYATNSLAWGVGVTTPPTTSEIKLCTDYSFASGLTYSTVGGTYYNAAGVPSAPYPDTYNLANLPVGQALDIVKGQSTWENNAGLVNFGNNQIIPFTAAHDGLIDPTEELVIGDIMVDVRKIANTNMSDSLSFVTTSTSIMQKAVIGVFVEKQANIYVPSTLKIPMEVKSINDESNTWTTMQVLSPEYEEIWASTDTIIINAIGEGMMNVCGENGNIEVGDYITTSSIRGKGMKQSDDLMHNYTVAKSRETVTFSSPTEVKLIACIYHCG